MTNRHVKRLQEIKNKKVILIKKEPVKESIEVKLTEALMSEKEAIKDFSVSITDTKPKKTYKKKSKNTKVDYSNKHSNFFNKDK